MIKLNQLVEHIFGLGYRFKDPALLRQAIAHSSYAFEREEIGEKLKSGRLDAEWPDNERLEFLGDAVLGLIVVDLLFTRHPLMREGDLSRKRADMVNEAHLALMAREIGLDDFILLGRGEQKSGGRAKPSILAGAFEAVVGAVYLDGGYPAAFALLQKLFKPWLARDLSICHGDAKTTLQETLQQRHGQSPVYELEEEKGPAHAKVFAMAVYFHGRVLGRGTAGSKKEAEQKAAAMALGNLSAKKM